MSTEVAKKRGRPKKDVSASRSPSETSSIPEERKTTRKASTKASTSTTASKSAAAAVLPLASPGSVRSAREGKTKVPSTPSIVGNVESLLQKGQTVGPPPAAPVSAQQPSSPISSTPAGPPLTASNEVQKATPVTPSTSKILQQIAAARAGSATEPSPQAALPSKTESSSQPTSSVELNPPTPQSSASSPSSSSSTPQSLSKNSSISAPSTIAQSPPIKPNSSGVSGINGTSSPGSFSSPSISSTSSSPSSFNKPTNNNTIPPRPLLYQPAPPKPYNRLASSTLAGRSKPAAKTAEEQVAHIYSGKLPEKYKPTARRINAIIVALPFFIVSSWILYQRLVLGVEPKPLPQPGDEPVRPLVASTLPKAPGPKQAQQPQQSQ